MINKDLDSAYRATYDDEAAGYDKDRFGSVGGEFAKRYKNNLIYTLLQKHGCLSDEKCILDIPSGTGRVAHMLLEKSSADVLAVDISPDMLKVNETNLKDAWRDRVTFLQANMRAIPRPDNSVDAAVMASFFYLVPLDEYGKYINDVIRLLKPGGYLIVEVSNTSVMNPFTLIKILYHKHIKRKSIKSYTYIWDLPRLFSPLDIVSIYGVEYPSPINNYRLYEKICDSFGRLPPLKWFCGKYTVILRKT